ncbi:hypothetical protein COO60DRAFT_857804 [Scenedesmus sp. NREL 46B-D3]|nr:hypothetical protein COO60DRAFT_857804 [Scenedesmus sp. NREL 46B-D3]
MMAAACTAMHAQLVSACCEANLVQTPGYHQSTSQCCLLPLTCPCHMPSVTGAAVGEAMPGAAPSAVAVDQSLADGAAGPTMDDSSSTVEHQHSSHMGAQPERPSSVSGSSSGSGSNSSRRINVTDEHCDAQPVNVGSNHHHGALKHGANALFQSNMAMRAEVKQARLSQAYIEENEA